ncbi:hypothetical protein J0H33_13785 [bacterium]|jgi:hypothetical protein|nr:hypothetical protein [bacterium]
MENLLNRAYFKQHCHECGHSYALTLYNILQEQQLAGEWHNLQGRDIDDPDTHAVLRAIPRESLEQLEQAWLNVADAAERAGLTLEIAPAPGMGEPHTH